MSDFSTVDAILDYAIEMEQAAVDLYTKIAEKAGTDVTKKVFLGFAAEERGHKSKLEAVKAGKTFVGSARAVQDLKIADYINDVVLTETPTYEEILVFAMKQEKKAFRMYTDLAARVDRDDMRELFLLLAQEEAKHKLRFEIEYDEHCMPEN